MKIKTYKGSGTGRVKVFFSINEESEKLSIHLGNNLIINESGFQFYVDQHVAKQIDKVDVDFSSGRPFLILKPGEELSEPELSEKEKEIERLEKELKKLRDAE